MKCKVKGYAAPGAKQPLSGHAYELSQPGPDEVLVRITHCGLCHSDVHLIDNDWGVSTYPLVPGHEIVGTVKAGGERVRHLAPGTRVGIGWQAGACFHCDRCSLGDEHFCRRKRPTCIGRPGGFADHILLDGRFAFPLPDGIPSEVAGPLMCAGLTVFTPLVDHAVKATMAVGVVGIGGLGHLALQFARAWGCRVTAFSGSKSKEAEAREFGAHLFVEGADKAALKRAASSQDIILVTAHGDLEAAPYVAALRPRGTLVFLGASPNPIGISPDALFKSKHLTGSTTGNRRTATEMLAFADRHGIRPKVELLPLAEINHAIEKVRRNEARYRMVLRVAD